jgi:hypothetical protein
VEYAATEYLERIAAAEWLHPEGDVSIEFTPQPTGQMLAGDILSFATGQR